MYPKNLHLETQVNTCVDTAIRGAIETVIWRQDSLNVTIRTEMESLIRTAIVNMHRHTDFNDVKTIKETLATNMHNVNTHLKDTDDAIIQIRKNITDHIESLVDKLHDHYMETETPFTNPESQRRNGPQDTTRMGAQPPHTPHTMSPNEYLSPHQTPQQTEMNDIRVELGMYTYKRDLWAHRLSNDPTRQEMEQFTISS